MGAGANLRSTSSAISGTTSNSLLTRYSTLVSDFSFTPAAFPTPSFSCCGFSPTLSWLKSRAQYYRARSRTRQPWRTCGRRTLGGRSGRSASALRRLHRSRSVTAYVSLLRRATLCSTLPPPAPARRSSARMAQRGASALSRQALARIRRVRKDGLGELEACGLDGRGRT